MKIKKTSLAGIALALVLIAGTTTVFATSADFSELPDDYNSKFLTTNRDGSWVYDKNGVGEILSRDEVDALDEVQLAPNNTFPVNISDKVPEIKEVQEQLSSTPRNEKVIFRAGEGPIYKDYDLVANNQVVYFDTQAELDFHLQELKDRKQKGLALYDGFDELYAHIDFSAPFGYSARR